MSTVQISNYAYDHDQIALRIYRGCAEWQAQIVLHLQDLIDGIGAIAWLAEAARLRSDDPRLEGAARYLWQKLCGVTMENCRAVAQATPKNEHALLGLVEAPAAVDARRGSEKHSQKDDERCRSYL